MLIETALLIIGIITVVSSIGFIAKSTSNITHSFGIPEYLASTIIICFVYSMPNLLLMLFSNIYDVPLFGISTIIGFSIVTLTLVMGIFLLKNDVPVEYEGYRNTTFMWAASLLFLISLLDKFIDRMEAVFMLSLFAFYVIYIYYRTGKSKEYVYLKTSPTNIVLYPLALFAIILSSFVIVGSIINLNNWVTMPVSLLGLMVFGLILGIPVLGIIKMIFKSSKLTFDSIIGNVIVTLTLIPGIMALILPIAYSGAELLFPLVFLNIISLFLAVVTHSSKNLYYRTGIILITAFFVYVVLLFVF